MTNEYKIIKSEFDRGDFLEFISNIKNIIKNFKFLEFKYKEFNAYYSEIDYLPEELKELVNKMNYTFKLLFNEHVSILKKYSK